MSRKQLYYVVGFVWFLSQLGVIAYVCCEAFVFQPPGFLFEEATTTLAIIFPMFAGFSLPFVRAVTNNTAPTEAQRENPAFVALTSIIIVAFVLAMCFFIHAKATARGGMTFEKFKMAIAGLQSVLGVYVGIVLGRLLGNEVVARPGFDVTTHPTTPQPDIGAADRQRDQLSDK
jgi:hypothetical protein